MEHNHQLHHSDAEDGETWHYRMDVIWDYVHGSTSVYGLLIRFEGLAKVALLVLTITHSNATKERVFSLMTKNKTVLRPSLKVPNPEPCFKYEPPHGVLEMAKKTAMDYYNRAMAASANCM